MATQAQKDTALAAFNTITQDIINGRNADGTPNAERRYTGQEFRTRIQSIFDLILSDEDVNRLITAVTDSLNAGTDANEVNRLITEALTAALADGGNIKTAIDSVITSLNLPTSYADASWKGPYTEGTYARNDIVTFGKLNFISRTAHTSGLGSNPRTDTANWEVMGHARGPYNSNTIYELGDTTSVNNIEYLYIASTPQAGQDPATATTHWARVSTYTEAQIKTFAGAQITDELGDGGGIKAAIDEGVATRPDEDRVREIADEEATPIPDALSRFVPVADKTRTIIDKVQEQHTSTSQITPIDNNVSSYYSYVGDVTAFSATNPDGYIASAGVTEVGSEIRGLQELATPPSANQVGENELFTRGENTWSTAEGITGLFGIRTGTSGPSSTFTDYFRVNSNGRLQVFAVQNNGTVGWRDILEIDSSPITVTSGESFTWEWVVWREHNTQVHVNIEVRRGTGAVQVANQTYILGNTSGFSTTDLSRSLNASKFEVAIVTNVNGDGLIRHDDQRRLFNTPTTNENRISGKIRASIHSMDEDTYSGTLNVTVLKKNGSDVLTEADRASLMGGQDVGETDTIDGRVNTLVLSPARVVAERWGKPKLPTDTVYDADIADFITQNDVPTDSHIDTRANNRITTLVLGPARSAARWAANKLPLSLPSQWFSAIDARANDRIDAVVPSKFRDSNTPTFTQSEIEALARGQITDANIPDTIARDTEVTNIVNALVLGNTFTYGSTVPNNADGENGDVYVRIQASQISFFRKTAGIWSPATPFSGGSGGMPVPGEDGDDGFTPVLAFRIQNVGDARPSAPIATGITTVPNSATINLTNLTSGWANNTPSRAINLATEVLWAAIFRANPNDGTVVNPEFTFNMSPLGGTSVSNADLPTDESTASTTVSASVRAVVKALASKVGMDTLLSYMEYKALSNTPQNINAGDTVRQGNDWYKSPASRTGVTNANFNKDQYALISGGGDSGDGDGGGSTRARIDLTTTVQTGRLANTILNITFPAGTTLGDLDRIDLRFKINQTAGQADQLSEHLAAPIPVQVLIGTQTLRSSQSDPSAGAEETYIVPLVSRGASAYGLAPINTTFTNRTIAASDTSIAFRMVDVNVNNQDITFKEAVTNGFANHVAVGIPF